MLNSKVLYLSLFLLFSTLTSAKTLKIGVLEYPPHVVVTDRGLSGPILEYLKQTFSHDYKKVQFIYLPNKRGLREINKGSIDLLFPYMEQASQLPTLESPILNVLPGLCFKKNNFIPFLSAPGALDGLNIGIPANLPLVPIFSQSAVNLKTIEGSDALKRGIQLILRDRIDGLYHPSPINIYHHSNPLSKTIACSLFYGFSRPVNIAINPHLPAKSQQVIRDAYGKRMSSTPYEYFLLNKS